MKNFLITAAIIIAAWAIVHFSPENREENALIKIWDEAESNIKAISTVPTNVQDFVELTAPAVMTFGFHDFEKKKLENAHFFTKRGFVSFYDAIKAARIDHVIIEDKTILESKILCTLSIKEQKDRYDRDVLHAEFVLHQTYISGDKMRQEWHNVLAVIMNKQDANPKYKPGLGIEQWLVTKVLTKNEAEETCTRSLKN